MKRSLVKAPKPNKKFLFITVFIVLLAASQWWSIRLVYNGQFKGQTAFYLAKIYQLSAGQIEKDKDKIKISLSDYLANFRLAENYTANQIAKGAAQETMPSVNDISDSIWRKISKEAWIKKIAKQRDITVTKKDLDDDLLGIGDIDALKNNIKNDLNVSFETYQDLIIKPLILEAKVYQYLLENFNDMVGMQKAQSAYDALVKDNRDFKEVAEEYSDDTRYIDNSLFLTDGELGNFGDSIRALRPGGYSKIVILPSDPGAYIIWRLEAKTVDATTQENVFELKGIAVTAKSMNQFFDDYLSDAQVNRWYQ